MSIEGISDKTMLSLKTIQRMLLCIMKKSICNNVKKIEDICMEEDSTNMDYNETHYKKIDDQAKIACLSKHSISAYFIR